MQLYLEKNYKHLQQDLGIDMPTVFAPSKEISHPGTRD